VRVTDSLSQGSWEVFTDFQDTLEMHYSKQVLGKSLKIRKHFARGETKRIRAPLTQIFISVFKPKSKVNPFRYGI
jgi:hypothetical protein